MPNKYKHSFDFQDKINFKTKFCHLIFKNLLSLGTWLENNANPNFSIGRYSSEINANANVLVLNVNDETSANQI